jgi:general nucleoside transport system permease protein
MIDFFRQVIQPDMFSSMIRLAVPIAYTALGAMFCERAGVTNIGLEGQILTSSFFAIVVTYFTNNLLIGIFCGIACSVLLSLIFWFLTVQLQGNQIIVGTGINIATMGLFGYLSFVLFNSPGVTPTVEGIKAVPVPLLSKIPWIGQAIFIHTPTVYLLPLVIIASFYILYKTPIGLRIRVAGDKPIVNEAIGVNVYLVRLIAIGISGILTGIAGITISIEGAKFYQDTMVAGRGFIGLAANISGGWTPIGGPLVSLLYGFSQALMFRIQNFDIPQEFYFMLPYILTIVVLVGTSKRSLAPQALGKDFKRKE